MPRHDPRTARFRALRQAGFSTTEARRLRESEARTRIAIRAIEEDRPIEEARFLARREMNVIRHDLRRDQVRQDVMRLQRTGDFSDQGLRKRWGQWMKNDLARFPKSAERIRRHIHQELLDAERPDDPNTEALSYKLTFMAIRGDMEPEMLFPEDIAMYERERR